MLTLRFPSGVLFDLRMRGGPLPERYDALGAALVDPGPLDFDVEEALDIREWLEDQPEEFLDDALLDAAVGVVNAALRHAGLCSSCGGPVSVSDSHGDERCARCGELSDF